MVGKTFNSERPRTGPVRTYVPYPVPRQQQVTAGRPRAKRVRTARVAPALHLLRLNLSPHYLADQCFYFKRSRGPGSRTLFAQGQSKMKSAICFLPSCAMYKDNAVANMVAEMGRDLVSTTARLSDLSMPLKGEVRRSPVQSARQPISRSGKFVRRAYSRRALDCEKDAGLTCMYAFSCMLSPIVIVEHTSV